jgi:cobalt-precorrin 5A hydrolase
MKTALIALSTQGALLARRIAQALPDADIFIHTVTQEAEQIHCRGTQGFESIVALTGKIFGRYGGLVYIVPCGVAVRAIAAHLGNKHDDPAVVTVDAGGRYAISLLSGHEGGANELALQIANILDAEPVITTTTEALKTVIAGIGCRRDVRTETVVEAVHAALDKAAVELREVRLLASADIKADETGLLQAATLLGIPLRFIAADEIRKFAGAFTRSDWTQKKVNLPAVAEPAALLAGRRTRLILPKTTWKGVTVALARENCM